MKITSYLIPQNNVIRDIFFWRNAGRWNFYIRKVIARVYFQFQIWPVLVFNFNFQLEIEYFEQSEIGYGDFFWGKKNSRRRAGIRIINGLKWSSIAFTRQKQVETALVVRHGESRIGVGLVQTSDPTRAT